MGEREQIEKLVERGSWLDGFNATRLRQSDGTTVDYVRIDPRLKPKKTHVWIFFWKPTKLTSDSVEQSHIANWRFRLAQ